MMAKTALDTLIAEAAKVRNGLTKLEQTQKLSYAGFMREALQIAGVDLKRIKQLEKDLNERPGVDAAQSFVRKLSREFAETRWPRPHPDAGKLSRIFGSEQADSQLAQLRATTAEAQVVAVRAAHERHGASVFGEIEDWDRHEKETNDLRETLHGLYEQMREVVCGLDLEIDVGTLLPDEQKRGLAHVSFCRNRDVNFADPGWPERLVEDALTIPFRKPKREREKLLRRKKAA